MKLLNNILIVGSGCREVCIIEKLIKDSKKLDISLNIFCLANCRNPYIIENCEYHLTNNYNLESLEYILRKFTPQFAIIGPENPLLLGYSDYLENKNIPVLGPLKIYAQIETSKYYCRNIIAEL